MKGRLHLSREGLNSDETYLLPLKFDAASFPVGVSEEVRYLVVTNPKYVYAVGAAYTSSYTMIDKEKI